MSHPSRPLNIGFQSLSIHLICHSFTCLVMSEFNYKETFLSTRMSGRVKLVLLTLAFPPRQATKFLSWQNIEILIDGKYGIHHARLLSCVP